MQVKAQRPETAQIVGTVLVYPTRITVYQICHLDGQTLLILFRQIAGGSVLLLTADPARHAVWHRLTVIVLLQIQG